MQARPAQQVHKRTQMLIVLLTGVIPCTKRSDSQKIMNGDIPDFCVYIDDDA